MSINLVSIVYFSGTGGTTRVAENLQTAFNDNGVKTIITQLNAINKKTENADLLFLIFPVYACNAPTPIKEFINGLENIKGKPAVVISVSGGGDISPNTACRVRSIRSLERKGYDVIYEKMLLMPSNWIVGVHDEIAIRLIRILPQISKKIVTEILSGNKVRIKPNPMDRFFSLLGTAETIGGKYFSKKIKVNERCIGCALCEKNCPRGNISIINNIPKFNDKCIICLKCIYSCPYKALEAGKIKFVVIKDGFDLHAVEKRMENVHDFAPIETYTKGWVWSGVRKYLKENADCIQ